jgi:ribosomal protein S18 acetylase RimI-like enzyme
VIIREALIEDVEGVEELGIRLHDYHMRLDQYYRLKPSLEPRKYYEKIIKSRNSVLIVAEENERIIGFIAGNIHRRAPVFEVEMRGWITDVYVLEERRRRGVGSELVKAISSWFDQNDICYIELSVDSRNLTGIDFWDSVGFETWNHVMKKKTSSAATNFHS